MPSTEANLTRAGQIVGTQPAVSNALARLRETFNDPLFVRTAQGMVPTPMAQNIIGPVRCSCCGYAGKPHLQPGAGKRRSASA